MTLANMTTALRDRLDAHATHLGINPRVERMVAAAMSLVHAALSSEDAEWEARLVESAYALRRVAR